MKARGLAVFIGLISLATCAWAESVAPVAAAKLPLVTPDVTKLRLASANALIFDAQADQPIYAKGADMVQPIASVTKLMTAMVVLDAGQPLDDPVVIGIDDFDLLKGSHSRLRLGSELPRGEMLRLALMASENRAASALGYWAPGLLYRNDAGGDPDTSARSVAVEAVVDLPIPPTIGDLPFARARHRGTSTP